MLFLKSPLAFLLIFKSKQHQDEKRTAKEHVSRADRRTAALNTSWWRLAVPSGAESREQQGSWRFSNARLSSGLKFRCMGISRPTSLG